MRPSFALNLSHDGIGLFARSGDEWDLLGEVALTAPDFAERLGALRAEALARASEGLTTKVIIPASQILYTEVDAPGPRPAMRRRQITAALEGMTPYDVADLVFDWTGRHDRVQVAVVARETLDEAESFAEDWGFAPVAFAGAPEPGDYAGEPWFGPTKTARSYLPEGEKVERDPRPTAVAMISAVLAARAGTARTTAAPASEAEADAAQGEAPDDAAPDRETPEIADASAIAPGGDEEITADHPAPLPTQQSEIVSEIGETQSPQASDFDAEEAADLAAALDTTGALGAEPEPAPAPQGALPPFPETPDVFADLSPETPEAPAAEDLAPLPEAAFEPAADPVAAQAAAPVAPEEEQALAWALDTEIAPRLIPDPEAEATDAGDVAGEMSAAMSEAPPVPASPVLPPEEIAEDPEGAEDALSAALGNEIAPETLAAVVELPLFPAQEPAAAPPTAITPEELPETADEAPFTEVNDEDPVGEDTIVPAPTFASRRDAGLAARQPMVAESPARPLGGAARLNPAGAPERKALFARTGETGVTAPGLALPAEPPRETEGETARRDPGGVALGGVARGSAAPEAGKPRAQGARPRVTAKPVKTPDSASPTEKTVFGARKKAQVGGKPKYLGAALIGGLVAFLAIVALWSNFLGGEEPPAPAPAPAQAPIDLAQSAATDSSLPGAALQDTPQMTLAEAEAQAQTAAEATAEDSAEAGPGDSAAPATPAPLPPAPETAPAGTLSGADAPAQATPETPPAAGVEPTVPAPTLPDPQLALPPGVALPPAESLSDTPPVTPSAPPPFDDLARVDPEGSFEPTPGGVVTPGGFTLYSGKPARVPRERPDTVRAKAQDAADAAARETADPAPYADPALRKFTPKPRPAAIEDAAVKAEATPAEIVPPVAPVAPAAPAAGPQDDGALLAPDLSPAAAKRLAALRPAPRPDAVLTLASAAAPAIEVEAADPFADATTQAVSVSRRPVNRPRNFKDSVDRALAAVAAETAAAAVPTRVAAAAPVAQTAPAARATAPAPAVELDEPEPTAVAPKLPTSASVAKQATETNALNLNEMNLIGIYGSTRDRRALIRMPNGRFIKVSVGDRLDGGKVTAISDSQLSYQKGARSYVLKLLKNG